MVGPTAQDSRVDSLLTASANPDEPFVWYGRALLMADGIWCLSPPRYQTGEERFLLADRPGPGCERSRGGLFTVDAAAVETKKGDGRVQVAYGHVDAHRPPVWGRERIDGHGRRCLRNPHPTAFFALNTSTCFLFYA